MEIWLQVLDKIQQNISKPSFDTWFSGTSAVMKDDVITVMSKNEFVSDWLEERYKTLILETVQEVTNHTYEIVFSISEGTSYTNNMRNSNTKDDACETLRKSIAEQNDLLREQQEKLQELEQRIYQLEQN